MNYFWRRLCYAITATSEKIDKTKKKKKRRQKPQFLISSLYDISPGRAQTFITPQKLYIVQNLEYKDGLIKNHR